ncbi:MAG: XRE family transcriptional regulator [Gammaproteobacteria bacterium RIFCSPHIGHO2_02_FULL_39_13]|nr:MAG: XRE family transcriptional regulator [Gammaproteobacteria bacterium RIFCSPHIGHO2_02_FULL_39_13]
MKNKIEHVVGSGNVYEDLGFSDSEERLAKAKLAMRIESVIEKRKLKQVAAAKILKISQPKISALMNGQVSGFSMERLIHFLNLLNQDVEIIIKTKHGSKSHNLGNLKVAFG